MKSQRCSLKLGLAGVVLHPLRTVSTVYGIDNQQQYLIQIYRFSNKRRWRKRWWCWKNTNKWDRKRKKGNTQAPMPLNDWLGLVSGTEPAVFSMSRDGEGMGGEGAVVMELWGSGSGRGSVALTAWRSSPPPHSSSPVWPPRLKASPVSFSWASFIPDTTERDGGKHTDRDYWQL